MVMFKKGLCFGAGIVATMLICLCIGSSVYAIQQTSSNIPDTYVYAQGNEFIWTKDNMTCEQMGLLLGVPVEKIEEGILTTGFDEYNKPILSNGIRIPKNSISLFALPISSKIFSRLLYC